MDRVDIHLKRAKKAVQKAVEPEIVAESTIYIVWFCYILGGWKALISTERNDGRYFEVTYNHHADEIYVDTYVKEANKAIQMEELND